MAGYGDFAYYYDLLTGNVDYESRADYISSLLAENGVGKGILLDLACGTGTVSLLMPCAAPSPAISMWMRMRMSTTCTTF